MYAIHMKNDVIEVVVNGRSTAILITEDLKRADVTSALRLIVGTINAVIEQEHGPVAIREAATLLGVTPQTLRNWEDHGLLASSRTEGGHRRYRLTDIRALASKKDGE